MRFRRRGWKRPYIQKRTPVAHHYASSRRDYSYRSRGEGNSKGKKGGEGDERAREEMVNVEEESSRICLLVARRKIARFSGAAPREKPTTRYQATSTTAVASCRAFGIAFVISFDASLRPCFAELESGLCAAVQGAQSPRCGRSFLLAFVRGKRLLLALRVFLSASDLFSFHTTESIIAPLANVSCCKFVTGLCCGGGCYERRVFENDNPFQKQLKSVNLFNCQVITVPRGLDCY